MKTAREGVVTAVLVMGAAMILTLGFMAGVVHIIVNARCGPSLADEEPSVAVGEK